jgi:hypothetical protein
MSVDYLIFAKNAQSAYAENFVRNMITYYQIGSNRVSRKQFKYISAARDIQGIMDKKLILLYGWRNFGYEGKEETLGHIEHLLYYCNCEIIGDLDDITKNEMKRFNQLRKCYKESFNIVDDIPEKISRFDLMIIGE